MDNLSSSHRRHKRKVLRRNLQRLRNVAYTPAELAKVLDINRRQIYRVYRHRGMPCKIDATGHISINGVEFREWYLDTFMKRIELGPDQTYCKTCRRGVEIVSPQICDKNGVTFLISRCPICGRKLSRIITSYRKQYVLRQQQEMQK